MIWSYCEGYGICLAFLKLTGSSSETHSFLWLLFWFPFYFEIFYFLSFIFCDNTLFFFGLLPTYYIWKGICWIFGYPYILKRICLWTAFGYWIARLNQFSLNWLICKWTLYSTLLVIDVYFYKINLLTVNLFVWYQETSRTHKIDYL